MALPAIDAIGMGDLDFCNSGRAGVAGQTIFAHLKRVRYHRGAAIQRGVMNLRFNKSLPRGSSKR